MTVFNDQTPVWEGVFGAIQSFFAPITNLFGVAIDTVVTGLNGLFPPIIGVIDWAIQGIGDVIGGISDAIGSVVPFVEPVTGFLGEAATAISDALTTVTGVVADAFSTATTFVGDVAHFAVDEVFNTVASVPAMVASVTTSAVNSIIEGVVQAPEAVATAFEHSVNKLEVGFATDFMTHPIEAISNVLGGVVGVVTSPLQAVGSVVNGALQAVGNIAANGIVAPVADVVAEILPWGDPAEIHHSGETLREGLGSVLHGIHATAEGVVSSTALQPVLSIIDEPLVHLAWNALGALTNVDVVDHPDYLETSHDVLPTIAAGPGVVLEGLAEIVQGLNTTVESVMDFAGLGSVFDTVEADLQPIIAEPIQAATGVDITTHSNVYVSSSGAHEDYLAQVWNSIFHV